MAYTCSVCGDWPTEARATWLGVPLDSTFRANRLQRPESLTGIIDLEGGGRGDL